MLSLPIHHIGYLVKNTQKAVEQFTVLGFQIFQNTIFDSIRQVSITFMEKDGYTVELVQPVSVDSVAAGLLKKYKNSPYHICYSSNHFTDDTKYLTTHGYLAIDEPTIAPACNNHNVQFFIHPSLGMIEIMDMHS